MPIRIWEEFVTPKNKSVNTEENGGSNMFIIVQNSHPFLCIIFTSIHSLDANFIRYNLKALHRRHVCNVNM